MEIGEVDDGEVESVVRLWHEAELVRPWNDPYADIALARAHPAAAVLVGRQGGTVVASAVVGFDGHRGWVYYVAVAIEERGNGLGRQLMTAAEDWLRRAGAPKVQLLVRTGNATAPGFYTALGYEPQDTAVLGKWLG